MLVQLNQSNAGGRWHLDWQHWNALRNAGWAFQDRRYAQKEFGSIEEAIEEFEKITKFDRDYCPCDCCGRAFSFTELK